MAKGERSDIRRSSIVRAHTDDKRERATHDRLKERLELGNEEPSQVRARVRVRVRVRVSVRVRARARVRARVNARVGACARVTVWA